MHTEQILSKQDLGPFLGAGIRNVELEMTKTIKKYFLFNEMLIFSLYFDRPNETCFDCTDDGNCTDQLIPEP